MTAVEDAKKLLKKAPKGKGTSADIEALKADMAGLDQAMTEVQGLIDTEDYVVAAEKATAVKAKAAEVAGQVTAALEKKKK